MADQICVPTETSLVLVLALVGVGVLIGGVLSPFLVAWFAQPTVPTPGVAASGHLAVQRDAQGRIIDIRQG